MAAWLAAGFPMNSHNEVKDFEAPGRVLRQLGNRPLLPSWRTREIKRFTIQLDRRISANEQVPIAATAVFALPCGQRRFLNA